MWGEAKSGHYFCKVLLKHTHTKATGQWDFPDGAGDTNLPTSAGDTRFDPWYRKIPHDMEQLSLCATSNEPMSHNHWARMLQLPKPTHLEPVPRNRSSHGSEQPAAHRNQRQPAQSNENRARPKLRKNFFCKLLDSGHASLLGAAPLRSGGLCWVSSGGRVLTYLKGTVSLPLFSQLVPAVPPA